MSVLDGLAKMLAAYLASAYQVFTEVQYDRIDESGVTWRFLEICRVCLPGWLQPTIISCGVA